MISLPRSSVKVVLKRLKIPLNLPLLRETFHFPFEKEIAVRPSTRLRTNG
jgi:hypothetical protein